MQLKGFVAGAAVVGLVWLGSTAWGNFAAEMQAASKQAPAGVYAADRGMTEAEKEAHVAEMRRLWEQMTPAQREAHRNMGVCPYSGRSAQGAVPRGAAPILRERRQPVEI